MDRVTHRVPIELHVNIDIAVQPGEHAQQPLHRHFTKPPVQQLRQVRLTNSDQPRGGALAEAARFQRSEEHTSELQSLMRISYAVFCLKKNTIHTIATHMN